MRGEARQEVPRQEQELPKAEEKEKFEAATEQAAINRLIADRDGLDLWLKKSAERQAHMASQLDDIKDPEMRAIAERMIKDEAAESERRKTKLEALNGELMKMAEAEIAALQGKPAEPITGENLEDALSKAADLYGAAPAPEAGMELEGPLETQARLNEEWNARQARIAAMGARVDARMAAEDAFQAEMEKTLGELVPEKTPEEKAIEAVYYEHGIYVSDAQRELLEAEEKFRKNMEALAAMDPKLKKAIEETLGSSFGEEVAKAREKLEKVQADYAAARRTALEKIADGLAAKPETEQAPSKEEMAGAERLGIEGRLAWLGKTAAELRKDLAGVNADLKKALKKKDYVAAGAYADALGEMNGRLAEMEKETSGLKERLEDAWFAEGDAMEAPEATESLVPEISTEDIADAKDLTPEEKSEAKTVVEKNELPPEKKAVLIKEGQALATEVEALKGELFDGYVNVAGDKVPGIETKLKEKHGIDPEKMSVSKWERFKVGLKSLFNADARKTLRDYRTKLSDYNQKFGDLQDIQFAIDDPKRYVAHKQRQVMKLSALRHRQKMAAAKAPKGGLFGISF